MPKQPQFLPARSQELRVTKAECSLNEIDQKQCNNANTLPVALHGKQAADSAAARQNLHSGVQWFDERNVELHAKAATAAPAAGVRDCGSERCCAC